MPVLNSFFYILIHILETLTFLMIVFLKIYISKDLLLRNRHAQSEKNIEKYKVAKLVFKVLENSKIAADFSANLVHLNSTFGTLRSINHCDN